MAEAPLAEWSKLTSTTSVGFSATHSPDRSVLQRLGPPGARPVKPEPPASFSSFGVSAVRSAADKLDVKPM